MTYEGKIAYSSFLLCALYVFIAGMASSAGKILVEYNLYNFRSVKLISLIDLFIFAGLVYSLVTIVRKYLFFSRLLTSNLLINGSSFLFTRVIIRQKTLNLLGE